MANQDQIIFELVLVSDADGVSPARYIVGKTTFSTGSNSDTITVSHIECVSPGHFIVYFDLDGKRLKFREVFGIPSLIKYETHDLIHVHQSKRKGIAKPIART